MDSFEKSMNHAEAGDSVMLFFRGTNPRNLYRGQTVSAACSMSAKTRFEGQVTILLPEEGGRDRPFNERFKPQVI